MVPVPKMAQKAVNEAKTDAIVNKAQHNIAREIEMYQHRRWANKRPSGKKKMQYIFLFKWVITEQFQASLQRTRRPWRSPQFAQHAWKRKRRKDLACASSRDKYWDNKAELEVENCKNYYNRNMHFWQTYLRCCGKHWELLQQHDSANVLNWQAC